MPRAQRLLEECPAELRGWEWNYVQRLCEDSLLTVHAGADPATSEVRAVAHNALGKYPITMIETNYTAEVRGVAVSPDGRLLAAASKLRMAVPPYDDWGEVQVWDIRTGREAMRLQGFKGPLFCCVAFSPDGKLLAAGGQKAVNNLTQWASVWDVATGREAYTVQNVPGPDGNLGWFEAVTFSPDSRFLAVGGTHNLDQSSKYQIILFDARTGKSMRTLDGGKFVGSKGSIGNQSLSFTPDGRLLAAIGQGIDRRRTLTNWEVGTGKKRAPITPNLNARTYHTEKDIGVVAYSPDGRRLLTCGGPVRVWDAVTCAELLTLAGQDSISGTWSPDGRRIAVGFGWGQYAIKVYDAGTGKELFTLRGHTGTAGSLAFSSDGSLLASGSPDGTARLWDADCAGRRWTR